LAGTKYRGDFENALNNFWANWKNSPNAILFIDEIHTIIALLGGSGGVDRRSNLLKPVLSSGVYGALGSTTFPRVSWGFEKDHA